MKNKHLKIDFLDVSIYVSFSNDIMAERQKWGKIMNCEIEKNLAECKSTSAIHSYIDDNPKDCALFFSLKAPLSEIVHECYHCIKRINFNHGIEKDSISDETGAYLIAWLFEQCVKIQKQK